jgi:indolepyruvate ferredoxin oxidoreductase beta subunit
MVYKNDVLIAGVGGQGNILAGRIIAQCALERGLHVKVSDIFGAAQRGGSVTSHIRVSLRKIYSPLIPKGQADVILGFEPLEALRNRGYASPEGLVILNTHRVIPINVNLGLDAYPDISDLLLELQRSTKYLIRLDATEIAAKIGDSIVMNMVMLGKLCSSNRLPFSIGEFKKAIARVVPKEKLKINLEGFKAGCRAP